MRSLVSIVSLGVVLFGFVGPASAQKSALTKTKSAAVVKTKAQTAAALSKKDGTVDRKKVEQYWALFEKAQTLGELEKAFEKSKFNDAELKLLNQESEKRELKTAMKKWPYFASIQKAAKDKAAKHKAPQGVTAKPSSSSTKKAVSFVSLGEVETKNKTTQSKYKSALKKQLKTAAVTATLKRPTAATKTADMALMSGHSIPSSDITISELRPVVATVGEDLIIRGSRFGNDRGRVTIAVWPEDLHNDEHYSFECPIQSWTNDTIVVTIPDSVSALLTEENWLNSELRCNARVLVKPSDGALGQLHRFEIRLPDSHVAPSVDEMSSNQWSPGQEIWVLGANFQFLRRNSDVVAPRIRIDIGDEQYNVEPVHEPEFNSGAVRFRVPPDIEGMGPTSGRLSITNEFNRSVSKTFEFIPLMETVTVTSKRLYARCIVGFTRHNPFCVVGDVKEDRVHAWSLDNGWVVESSNLRTSAQGINSGAYYVQQPAEGATDATAVYRVWADAYSEVSSTDTLVLKGPKGTFNDHYQRWCRNAGDCDKIENTSVDNR